MNTLLRIVIALLAVVITVDIVIAQVTPSTKPQSVPGVLVVAVCAAETLTVGSFQAFRMNPAGELCTVK